MRLMPLLPLLALALDLVFKDPRGWPHPVRLLGTAANSLESLARALPAPLRLSGAMCVLLLSAAAWFSVAAVISLPIIGLLTAIYFSYAGLALGGLLEEGRHAAALLRRGRIEQARTVLAGLVSRDVSRMDENSLRRSLAETMSENFNDAFVAPFMYLVLLGPPGLWAYKTVSTMDSMWGYTTDRWKELGWAAARLDDLLAFVPARLSALALLLCARCLGYGQAPSWRELAHQASRTASPNAGWPMAAAALLFQAGMGGPARYFGMIKNKPWLGPPEANWDELKLDNLLRLIRATGICVALSAAGICFALHLFFA